jgi:DNA-binding NtrC family response regulator
MKAEPSGVFGPVSSLTMRRVLIVDDDVSACGVVADWLIADGFDTEWHTSAEGALRAINDTDFGAVVTDFHLPGMQGGELCRRILAGRHDVAVIVATALGGTEAIQQATQAGAYDFIAKPYDLEVLSMALRRAFERRAFQLEVRRLRRAVRDDRSYGELYGVSKVMRRLYDSLDAIADLDSPVLITGEVGTGREAVARELHLRSRRGAGPFVAFNCVAMPAAVLMSNLFGHVRGAFGSALSAHPGLLGSADRGTIFVSGIADLPAGVQSRLVRAIERKRIVPVGGSAERTIDVRIMASTHRDLGILAEEGSFRHDLFRKISAIPLAVPPLRERSGDVLLLADYFIETACQSARKEIAGLSPAAAERMAAYDWPGNVRELRNCVERAVFLTRSTTIEVSDLPERIRKQGSGHHLVGSSHAIFADRGKSRVLDGTRSKHDLTDQ